ncbi:DNAse I-like superfamily protein [Rhynchospora pubera]|uniref:DNAse I-like superfamily protein n=1 Tax=Rhynchospora pubera TaxID=906938 RepID=A0AAV8C2R5_9POAL|nr:DNAse I-like superfamily protein [Rhynchospora pubera]
MIAKSGLMDLGYHGAAYTWSNKRQPHSIILQRLDRALATVPWCNAFPAAKLFHLPKANSDHCPILLSLEPDKKKVKRSFKFENWWLYREGFKEICENAIGNGEQSWDSVTKRLKKEVQKWVRTVRSPQTELTELEQQLVQIQMAQPTQSNFNVDQQLQEEYNSRLLEVEAYWAQRARIKWAQHGDLNTSFFHHSVTKRRTINRISSLVKEDGSVIADEKYVRKAFVEHYKSVYTLESPCAPCHLDPQLLNNIPKLNTTQAEALAMHPMDQEIIEAVFAIHPDRASGPDEINGRAVQTF